MPSMGDIVTVLSVDERRMTEGLKRAEMAAQRAGVNFGMAFQQGGARMAQQAGFMLQDFTSVLSMGGANALPRALSGVMNNVQMLGAAFGPVGMAATALGGALAGILLPELLKADDVIGKYLESLKEQEAALDRQVASIKRVMQAQQELDRMVEESDGKGIERARKRADNDLAQIQAEIQARGRALQGNLNQAMANDPNAFRQFAGPRQMFDDGGRINPGVGLEFADPKMAEAFKRQMDALNELQQKEREIVEQRKRLNREENPAKARAADMEGAKRAFEEENRLFKQRVDAIREMEDRTRSPAEKFAEELTRIQQMLQAGDITPELASRAIVQAREGLPPQRVTQEAAMFGSSAAASAIIKAEANASRQAEEFRIQQNILDELKQQKQALQDIKANTENWMVVDLP